VPVDYEQAALWYQRSADHGHERAKANLGELYMDGRGVPLDVEKGVRLIRDVAETGDEGAMYDLARAYKFGEGVAQDDAEALRWLRRAADGGHSIAAHTLGRVYLEGDGVKRDRQEALVWFIVADARMPLNGRTADERKEYARSTDALVRALPREQVEAARQRAQQILADLP